MIPGLKSAAKWMFTLQLIIGCGQGRVDQGSVYMEDGVLMKNGERFFPIAINYIASVHVDGPEIWIGRSKDYARDDPDRPRTANEDQLELEADMELINDMGFNTVRIVGFSDLLWERDSSWMQVLGPEMRDTLICLEMNEHYTKYLDAVERMVEAAGKARLHVILLTQLRPYRELSEERFTRIAKRLKGDTTVLAYDLFNEPLYFDPPERNKKEIFRLMKQWRALFDAHASHQLYTLGLTGIRETFEFDPSMLEVDFISFHPYEYEPDQVRNEMRWYHDHVHVPWMIGETAIPADDDSVPHLDQALFAERTIRQSIACGAIGYSWWQFQDVKWGRFHPDHMGVLSREGYSTTTQSGHRVKGTMKPVVDAIRNAVVDANGQDCERLENYYNYSPHTGSRLIGRVVDDHGVPIEGAVILGWNKWWDHSYHTITRPDGSFELRGDFYFHHWMISAMDYSMVRGDVPPSSARSDVDGIPSMQLGTRRIKRLSL